VAEIKDEAEFTFSWLALKLLGRGLYSNPWSALSELVANGLDAGATQVYVFVDASNKEHATVEVIDNGSGMSRSDISTYVKVGHNKRLAQTELESADKNPKGRKGIGKLAALFLSSHFYLSTRHQEESSIWELDARDAEDRPNEHPHLIGVESPPSTPNSKLWADFATGTRITMLDVDLTGYGLQAVNALGVRLANQFLLPEASKPEVLLWVKTSSNISTPNYERVQKSIAFGNFSEVLHNIPWSDLQPAGLLDSTASVALPAKGLPGNSYTHRSVHAPMTFQPEEDDAWAEIEDVVDLDNKTYRGIPFSLTGWIAMHATIEVAAARENDAKFTKNKYYNPAQVRLYVRGKLASDRLLSQLGLTGTYANYIEGEISFDILDHDDLPDIATSNRQDFDETDSRMTLLRTLLRPLTRTLINHRNTLASTITAKVNEEKARRETASKKQFTEQLQTDLNYHDTIPQSTRDELQLVITNKIQGDVSPKQSYRVFISHSKVDSAFATLIDELLQHHGAKEDEIFFTSRTGSTDMLLNAEALSKIVKRSITNDNTLVFYLTSKHFSASQFCLFEGGAGWATRATSEYLKLNMDYGSIPKWLTDGQSEAILLSSSNTISLTPEVHNYLVTGILNPMIKHLNRGRDIDGDEPIRPYDKAVIPSSVEMQKTGTEPKDYYDASIVQHWNAGIDSGLSSYLEKYFAPSESSVRIKELELEIAALKAQIPE
jgi:hypothetical protein